MIGIETLRESYTFASSFELVSLVSLIISLGIWAMPLNIVGIYFIFVAWLALSCWFVFHS